MTSDEKRRGLVAAMIYLASAFNKTGVPTTEHDVLGNILDPTGGEGGSTPPEIYRGLVSKTIITTFQLTEKRKVKMKFPSNWREMSIGGLADNLLSQVGELPVAVPPPAVKKAASKAATKKAKPVAKKASKSLTKSKRS